MKGGREEGGKVTMSPLFPRLHVNDAADKGGPRAPPRNKMALYEQFTIPSQRFTNKSAPSLLLPAPPPQRIGKVVVQSSTSGCGQEGAMFSSYYLPRQLPACMNEEVHSHSFNAKGTKSRMSFEREKSSLRSGAYRSFKSLRSDGHVPSSMDSNSFPKQDSTKSSGRKRVDDDDDFRVPTFVHKKAVPSSDKDQLLIRNALFKKNSETGAGNTCNSSDQLPIISGEPPEELVHISLMSRKRERDYSQWKTKETVKLKDNFKRPEFSHELEGKTVEPFIPKVSSDCENGGVNIIELEKSPNGRTKIYCESAGDCGANCNIDSQKCSNSSEDAEERESLRVQMSDAKSPVNFKTIEDEGKEDYGAEPLDQKNAKKVEDYETSVLDSGSGFDISPDDVAGMIGAKHFWKARRVIFNQQRVFALQVFELHRLIKVQKLIAASPQILLQGGSFVARSTTVASKNASETAAKSQLLNWEEKNDSQKANDEHVEETLNQSPSAPICTEHGMKHDSQKSGNNEHIPETSKEAPSSYLDEHIDETTKPPSTLPDVEHVLNEGSAVQGFRNGNHSGQFSVASAASENSPTPWCFPPPTNQWLIPVMSPSDGLVYKPCMGPYPPSMGFMPAMLGGCRPVAMPPVGDFMTYDFPAPNQQHSAATVSGAPVIAPSFYPIPCGFPFMNPSVDAGQMSPFPVTQPKKQNGEHSGYSGNVVKPISTGFSANSRCVQASRGSEFHGSTASSPSERLHEAMDPSAAIHMPVQVAESSCQSSQVPPSREHQSRVIKVVPHNPRRATESVARIFKCIQQEKQL